MRYLMIALFSLSSFANNNYVSDDEISTYFQCGQKDEKICHYLFRGIRRDQYKCPIDPFEVERADELITKPSSVVWGVMKYLGFFPGRYGYFPISQNRGMKIMAKVHFKNLKQYSQSQINSFKKKFEAAERIWESSSPYSYPIDFEFEIETNPKKAHIKNINLLNKPTRGPYFLNWSFRWSVTTIAHEFGHVLGLDDEYKNRPGRGDTSVCFQGSIMCRSNQGKPLETHYYQILRRTLCSKALRKKMADEDSLHQDHLLSQSFLLPPQHIVHKGYYDDHSASL